jgi:hypothetical protein
MNKNWLNDTRASCKVLFSLIVLIKSNVGLEEELEEELDKFWKLLWGKWIEKNLLLYTLYM